MAQLRPKFRERKWTERRTRTFQVLRWWETTGRELFGSHEWVQWERFVTACRRGEVDVVDPGEFVQQGGGAWTKATAPLIALVAMAVTWGERAGICAPAGYGDARWSVPSRQRDGARKRPELAYGLAAELGASRATVRKALEQAEAAGWLYVLRPFGSRPIAGEAGQVRNPEGRPVLLPGPSLQSWLEERGNPCGWRGKLAPDRAQPSRLSAGRDCAFEMGKGEAPAKPASTPPASREPSERLSDAPPRFWAAPITDGGDHGADAGLLGKAWRGRAVLEDLAAAAAARIAPNSAPASPPRPEERSEPATPQPEASCASYEPVAAYQPARVTPYVPPGEAGTMPRDEMRAIFRQLAAGPDESGRGAERQAVAEQDERRARMLADLKARLGADPVGLAIGLAETVKKPRRRRAAAAQQVTLFGPDGRPARWKGEDDA